MYKKNNTLTADEKCRLDEVIFFKLIQKMYSMHANPTKVFDLISLLSELTKCNVLIINSAVAIVFTNDARYLPTRAEYMYLLGKAAIPVREICTRVGVSCNTYYESVAIIKQRPAIKPMLSSAQSQEISKFLDGMDTLKIFLGRT